MEGIQTSSEIQLYETGICGIETATKVLEGLDRLKKENPGQFEIEFSASNTTPSEYLETTASVYPLYDGKKLSLLPLLRPGRVALIHLDTGQIEIEKEPYSGCSISNYINSLPGGASIYGTREQVPYDQLKKFWNEAVQKVKNAFDIDD